MVAVSFHVGLEPQAGHYRTAIWEEPRILFDDNGIAEKCFQLADLVLRNCCVLWLLDDQLVPSSSEAGSLALRT